MNHDIKYCYIAILSIKDFKLFFEVNFFYTKIIKRNK